MAIKRRRPVEPPSVESRFTAVLEGIDLKLNAVIESISATRAELRMEIGEAERRLTSRIEALEIAVRRNSEDIRKNSEDIRRNSEDIRQLSEELARLTDVVAGKVDRRDFDALEARVARLEARLGG